MALKMRKARREAVKRLQGRLRRENALSGETVFSDTSFEAVSSAYRELSREQRRRVTDRRLVRRAERASLAVSQYNDTYANRARGTHIHDFITPALIKKKGAAVTKLTYFLGKLSSTPRGEVLTRLKSLLKPLLPFKRSKAERDQSVTTATAGFVNQMREAMGLMTIAEESNFNNILKAFLRVGAYTLYARALENGRDFVGELYRRGISIPEVYLSSELNDDEPTPYASDDELARLGIAIDKPETFPTAAAARKLRSSDYGRALNAEITANLRRRL